MAKNLAQHIGTRETPQNERIPGAVGQRQVENSAGGFVFEVSKWDRLNRFLILGSEGGSYYANERELTRSNAQAVLDCASEDFDRTLQTVVDVSLAGRAPKNDPAILALALLASHSPPQSTKALAELNKVCRIGTHLFQFNDAIKHLRGRGRSYRRAIQQWYLSREPKQVAYQATKYQQREGWGHSDMLRLSKPTTEDPTMDGVFAYIVGKDWKAKMPEGETRTYLEAVEAAKRASSARDIVQLINDHQLVREVIPTQFLNSPEVWEAMLPHMPLTAMVRNLGKMSNVGLLKPMSNACKAVVAKLGDEEYIRRSRVHPIAVLIALTVYQAGRGFRGSLSWSPDSKIVDALDDAFYKAFPNVQPTGKRHLLAVDVSGSMGCGQISGTFLTPRMAAAAMAMVAVRCEEDTHLTAFSGGGGGSAGRGWQVPAGQRRWSNDGIIPVALTKRARLDHAVKTINSFPMGCTDCSLPMQYALDRQIETDVFVIYTDSETWAGNIHPVQALRKYRERINPKAKLIVVGLVSNGFTIADPHDAGMMDVVGFDTAAPQVMAEFVRDRE